MYNFIFWVVFYNSGDLEINDWLSRWKASCVVYVAAGFHIFFLYAIGKKYLIQSLNLNAIPTGKLWGGLFFTAMLVLVFRFYSKSRVEKIVRHYSSQRRNQPLDILLVVFLIVVPLGFIIWINPGATAAENH